MNTTLVIRSWLVLPTLLSALACNGCSDEFEPSSRVVNLRLLAVQADHPYAKPGEQVQLTALYHDPHGRPLSWAFGLCDTPESSTAQACALAIDLAQMTIGTAPQYTLQIPERSLGDSDTGNTTLGVAVVACPGIILPGDTAGVPLTCVDESGRPLDLNEFEVGMKRIFVRSDDEQNQNPAIEMVLWDGERWPEGEQREASCDGDKCKKHALEIRAPGAEENATDEDGKPIRERLIVQFYGTGGTFEDDVRLLEEPDTTWKPRPEDHGQLLTLWFVVRDDRGGVSFAERRVRVP